MAEEVKVLATREYRISLRRAYYAARTRRAKRAVALIREFVSRHIKVDPKSVKLDPALNEFVWSRSREKPPRYVDVVVEKRSDGTALVKLKQ